MAKNCTYCGQPTNEQSKYCTNCGADLTQTGPDLSTSAYTLNGEPDTLPEVLEKEKVFLGILGAFLFSLAGGVIYVILYQFGVLAAICGWVTFILAGIGYRKFSKTKEKFSVKSIVVSIVMLIVVTLLAEYVCLAIEIYKVLAEDYYITILDAFLSVPLLLTDGEVLSATLSDLGFSYLFGFIAVIGNIVNFFKGRKAEKEALSAPHTVPAETTRESSEETTEDTTCE